MSNITIPNIDNTGVRHKTKKTEAQMFETKQKKGDVTEDMLRGMTVGKIRQAVRFHNLHYAIRGYSRLKKADLIKSFMLHYKNVNPVTGKLNKPPATRPNQQILKKRTEQIAPGSTLPLFGKMSVQEGAEELFNKTYKKKDAAKTKEEKLAAYRKHVAEYIKRHPESAPFLNDRENEERDAADFWKRRKEEQKKLKLLVSGKRKRIPTQKAKENAAQAAQAAQVARSKKTVTKKPQRPKRKITETVRLKESKEQNKKKTATKKPKKKVKTPDMFKTARL